jgi:hypothetical protein
LQDRNLITDTPVGRDAAPDAGEDARTTLNLTSEEIFASRAKITD